MNTSVTSTVKGVVIHNEKSPLMCLYRKVYVRKAELSVGLPYSYHFYPRPVLGIGYCRCLCVCVYQSLTCPHDNSSPVQARITKFGPEKQNTLIKIPIVFFFVFFFVFFLGGGVN